MCNIVDIRKQSNYELVVQIRTDINNQGREFYTDINGFQVWTFETEHEILERIVAFAAYLHSLPDSLLLTHTKQE